MHRAAAALAAAACFCASVISITWAWADLTARAAVSGQDAQAVAAADAASLELAHYRLQQTCRLNPLNADYAFELARFRSWLAWRSQGFPARSITFRSASVDSYRAVTRLRPTWGFAWINLAESNLLAGRNHDETRFALERAIKFAPLESATQLKVLWVGFSIWDDLSRQTRNEVRITLRNAILLNNGVDQIIRLAIQTNRTAELEGLLEDAHLRELYERLMAGTKSL